MTSKRNLIAHYNEGTSDKVYMSCVRQDNKGLWVVLGKFGRRGKTMQCNIKLTTANEAAAVLEQEKIFKKELSKGYRDIDDPSYKGTVSRSMPTIKAALEPEDAEIKHPYCPTCNKPMILTRHNTYECVSCSLDSLEKQSEQQKEFVEDTVFCIDNTGLESRFDVGVEYVCEVHQDKKMIYVYDKEGMLAECLRERFKFQIEMPRQNMMVDFIKFREKEDVRLLDCWDKLMTNLTNSKHFNKLQKTEERILINESAL